MFDVPTCSWELIESKTRNGSMHRAYRHAQTRPQADNFFELDRAIRGACRTSTMSATKEAPTAVLTSSVMQPKAVESVGAPASMHVHRVVREKG